MAGRYQIEELLKLRESPLVAKPDGLPPAEEWMGPMPDPATQKKHLGAREQANPAETTNRRPSFLEPRHISRPSNSEELVLGPPRTSFASASRTFGKSADGSDRPSLRSNEAEEATNDRYNFRDKFFKDREYDDKDPERGGDTRQGMANGRRIGREDKEDFTSNRPRRTFSQDDGDRGFRRFGDRDRWASRDLGDGRDRQESGHDRGNRDKDQGRYPPRRDAFGRPRHDQSWFRDGEATTKDGTETQEERHSLRNREWRRGTHGQERDWSRGQRQEQDPEWLDSTDKDSTKTVPHTQEDFQRWKERMKASAAQSAQQDKSEEPADEPDGQSAKIAQSKRAGGEIFSAYDQSSHKDVDLDKFFGLWSEKKQVQEAGTDTTVDGNVKKEAGPARPAKASRFAGIFNAASESHTGRDTNQTQTSPQPDDQLHPASSDADQQGFQRILQMLGGNKAKQSVVQSEEPLQSRQLQKAQPHHQPIQDDFGRVPVSVSSPARESFAQSGFPAASEGATPRRLPPGLEIRPAQNFSNDLQSPKPDADFLLRLMQRSKISQPQPPPPPQLAHQQYQQQQTNIQQQLQQQPIATNVGSLPLSNLDNQPQHLQKQRRQAYLDDPSALNVPRPETQDARDPLRQRIPNGPTAGYFDDVFPGGPVGNPTPSNPPGIPPPQMHGQPQMGLQRPPGLEPIMSPGWTSPQVQQGGAPPIFPSGFSNVQQQRSFNQHFPATSSLPLTTPGMPQPNDRQVYLRGAMGGGGPGFNGGMMSPLPYMNMNVPPAPAYGPMVHNVDGMMGLPPASHPQYGAAGLQNLPQQPSRQLLELFGRGNGNVAADGHSGGRNGSGLSGPGQYR